MVPSSNSCLENPMDGGAWWAAVHGVAKSRTRLSDFTFMHWRRKWQPTPVFLPGESQGWGAWWAAFYGVAQGRTQLKQLSSSSSSSPFPGAQFPTRFFPPVLPDYMEVGVFTNLILYEFCQFPVNFP